MYRAYLKTFKTENDWFDWEEITDYLLPDVGFIETGIDAKSFDIGNYKISSLNIALDNRTGRFNDVDHANTIFNIKRNNSQLRIDWEQYGQTSTLYKGLLRDDAFRLNSTNNRAIFTVVGRESLFSDIAIVGGSLTTSITLKTAMYTILNRTEIKNLLTVSLANINPTNGSMVLDSIDWFTNKSVKEGIDELLFVTDSVLVIENDTIYIKSRQVSADTEFNFWGQNIPGQIENILSVINYNTGRHRVFNEWIWGTNTTSSTTSISKYGRKTKTITSDFISNSTKRDTLISELLSEFKWPKAEFEISTYMAHVPAGLDLLDRIIVTYPKVITAAPGASLPLCGKSIAGVDVTPYSEGAFEITADKAYKILGFRYDIRSDIITFRLREKGRSSSDGYVYSEGTAVCGAAICGEAICGQS